MGGCPPPEVRDPRTDVDALTRSRSCHHQQLTSLQEYILVSQDQVYVEHHLREGTYWLRTEFQELEDVMSLPSIECELCLRDIYNSVDLSH